MVKVSKQIIGEILKNKYEKPIISYKNYPIKNVMSWNFWSRNLATNNSINNSLIS